MRLDGGFPINHMLRNFSQDPSHELELLLIVKCGIWDLLCHGGGRG